MFTTEIPAEVAVRYNDVNVYHVYRNDEVGQGKRTFLFTLSPYGGETNGEAFDVRELPEWEPLATRDENGHVRDILKKAIDAGTLTNPPGAEIGYLDDGNAGSRELGVAGALLAAVRDRETVDAALPELLVWAGDALDEDLLWETIGPLVDAIEQQAQQHFGTAS